MTSSEERREVAKRLRVYSHDFDFGDSDPFWYVAKAAFGDVDAHTYHSVFARLADLIDPTCRAVHQGTSMDDELVCSECVASLGVEADGKRVFVPNFCSCCGSRVVRNDE